MSDVILKLLFIAFTLNLVYELCHSILYHTCWDMALTEYVPLMLKAAAIDAVWITLIFLTTSFNIVLFLVIAIVWAYIWEVFSLRTGRWEYSILMPRVFGVGLTPLVKLALTGILSFYILFGFLK